MRLTPIDFPLFLMLCGVVGTIYINDWFLLFALVMCIDCSLRLVEYNIFRKKPWSPRLGNRFKRSRCGRNLACYIWGQYAIDFYKARGYKFYHIIPDDAPRCFFKPSFWQSFFSWR